MRPRGWWPALVLVLLVAGSAFPFYWAILSSFTPEARLFQNPWPGESEWDIAQVPPRRIGYG